MAKRSVKSSASDYATLLQDIKSRLCTAQIRAALSVNAELTLLYWNIGRAIVLRQKDERWGKSVVERLSGQSSRTWMDSPKGTFGACATSISPGRPTFSRRLRENRRRPKNCQSM